RQPGRAGGRPPRPLLLVPPALGERREDGRGGLGPPLLCPRGRRGADRHLGGGGARDRQTPGPRPVLRRLPRQRACPADHCHLRELGVSAPSRHQPRCRAQGAPEPDAGPAQHRRARGRDTGPGPAATGGTPVVAQVAIRPPDLSAPGVRGRLRRWHRFPPVLLGLACLTAALMAVPVAAVVVQAVSVGAAEAVKVLHRPLLPTLLAHTVQLTVLVGIGCAVVGVGAAWAVERTDLPGRKAFRLLLVLPLAVPEFVAGFGWLSVFPAVQGLKGATLVSVFTLYPWVYLPVAATLRNIDPAGDDVARTLGLGPVARFVRVTLPSIRFPLLGGVLIISLYLLAEYGAFAILRFQTLATAIFTEYSLRFNGQTASLFSLILCLLGVGLLLGEYRLRGRARRVRTGAGGRAAPPVRLGKGAPVALLAVGLVVLLGLGVPLGSIVYWMV